MPKFPNLSRKNLIILISSLSVLVLIVTFFVINFQNNSKLGDANSTQNSTQNSNQNSNQNSVSNSSFSAILSANSVNQNSSSSISNSQNSSISSNLNQKIDNSQTNFDQTLPNLTNISNNSSSVQNTQNSMNLSANLPSLTQNPIANLPNNNSNSQTYTNPNYPNLKINYNNSWKIERSNSKSIKTDNPDGQLMDGTLTLTKNNTTLRFNFSMPQRYGGGFSGDKILANLGKFKRYNQSIPAINEEAGLQKNKYYYTESAQKSPMNRIKTNLTKKDVSEKELKYIVPNEFLENKLNYWLLITLDSTSPAEIAEADEIIKNSVLE